MNSERLEASVKRIVQLYLLAASLELRQSQVTENGTKKFVILITDHPRPLFRLSKQLLQQINVKNVHPIKGARN